MCGIVGMVLKGSHGPTLKHEGILYDALYADAIRGFDATGLIGVENDTTFHIAKEAVEATYFISGWKALAMSRDMYSRGKAYIGHNRKKTMGKHSDENAHPFVINNHFALVHNGTLYNHTALADTDVDSKALAIVLEKAFGENSKEALEETLGQVFGAYACVAYDQRSNKVHLFRNKERPLSVFETPDAWYWASEGMMMQWCLTRDGRYTFEQIKFVMVPEHTLFTFDLDKTELAKEEFVPKKASSLSSKEHHGKRVNNWGSGTTATSKSELKKLRRQWLGKKFRFDVDDVVECTYPSELSAGKGEVMLFGSADVISVGHNLYATVAIDNLGLDPNDVEADILGRKWMGTVAAIDMGANDNKYHFTMDEVKPILKSLPTKPSAITPTLEDQTKWDAKLNEMSDAELDNRLKHPHGLFVWQIKAIRDEQTSRQGVNQIEKLFHETPPAIH